MPSIRASANSGPSAASTSSSNSGRSRSTVRRGRSPASASTAPRIDPARPLSPRAAAITASMPPANTMCCRSPIPTASASDRGRDRRRHPAGHSPLDHAAPASWPSSHHVQVGLVAIAALSRKSCRAIEVALPERLSPRNASTCPSPGRRVALPKPSRASSTSGQAAAASPLMTSSRQSPATEVRGVIVSPQAIRAPGSRGSKALPSRTRRRCREIRHAPATRERAGRLGIRRELEQAAEAHRTLLWVTREPVRLQGNGELEAERWVSPCGPVETAAHVVDLRRHEIEVPRAEVDDAACTCSIGSAVRFRNWE